MRLRKDLLVLECGCGCLEIVTNEEFVELFRNDEIETDLENVLAEILDEVLDNGEFDCEFCEFDCDECEL